MIFSNDSLHGGTLRQELEKGLKESRNLTIATGYFGQETLQKYHRDLVAMASRGTVRILIGMVFHTGVGKKQLAVLQALNTALQAANGESGIFISLKEYHGKVYLFDDAVFVGSSNFSESGIADRWECTARIGDGATVQEVRRYIDYLLLDRHAKNLVKVDLSRQAALPPDEWLKGLVPAAMPTDPVMGEMEIKLRVDAQPRSSLNLFFDQGRKNGKTGLYSPRPWYEVEITTTTAERANPLYPKTTLLKPGKKSKVGSFQAYVTFRGQSYRMAMSVGSDSGKAIASAEESGGRATLGLFIKGKLEDRKLLTHGSRITSQTLEDYGRDSITLKKLNDQEYILEF